MKFTKKLLSLALLGTIALNMVACGNNAQTSVPAEPQKTITITSYNANKELTQVDVPFDPQRIAVMDMPALDIIDALGLGDRVVGSSAVSIGYLSQYNPDDSEGRIINLGTLKTADMEKVAASQPDIIFIGGRLSSVYDQLSAIAPVVYLGVDYDKGVVESAKANAQTIASIFGKEAEVENMFSNIQPRIDALNSLINGKNVLLAMYNSNTLGLMDTKAQLNISAKMSLDARC